jgi:Beta-lactamase
VLAYTLDAQGSLLRDRRLDVDYGPLYSDLGMTVADFARFLGAPDAPHAPGTHGPLSAASVEAMSTPRQLADGTFAGELFQWSRYGLGVGLDDFLGERVVLHSGHSGVGFVRFPERKLAVAVFTNLEHRAGSDPVGLALGIAGMLAPELSLVALTAQPAGGPQAAAEAALDATLRTTYEALLAGSPALDRYAPALRGTAWNGAADLAGRRPRWGALRRFERLRDTPLDGERSLLYRAAHERATAYLRISLDAEGRISRLVWWHP